MLHESINASLDEDPIEILERRDGTLSGASNASMICPGDSDFGMQRRLRAVSLHGKNDPGKIRLRDSPAGVGNFPGYRI